MSELTGSARLAEKLARLSSAERLSSSVSSADNRDKAVPIIVCVGTDRSTGDAFGPLIGTFLREAGYPRVFGTLDDPWDSSNLAQRVTSLPHADFILAVDCCVGAELGKFRVQNRPLEPGKSMGKPLPSLGTAALLGVVAPNYGNPYSMLQTASLCLVMEMARLAAAAILAAYMGDGIARRTD
ncbi:spore protease YyaC [Gorillibacterium massiliense]|uniref:spore protease YyaC n=1 Tax=Gorillibacterium massiliense TaxID=1280390 RepID=UPI0004B45803|nr:spore protease YyaC [Gorillibacterium massiliense]